MSADKKGKPLGLLIRLADAYAHNGDGQPCADDPLDIAREELAQAFPGLRREEIDRLAAELGPGALQQTQEVRFDAMADMLRGEQAEVLKHILFRVWEAPKPRLSVGCLLLSIGIKPLGVASERALAQQQQVSPEHVSNIVQSWQQMLNLPRTDFQKSAAAVAAAKAHNRPHTMKAAA